jgi:hypothetical protein
MGLFTTYSDECSTDDSTVASYRVAGVAASTGRMIARAPEVFLPSFIVDSEPRKLTTNKNAEPAPATGRFVPPTKTKKRPLVNTSTVEEPP